MKKMVFAVLSLLVVAMFLVGCAEKELSTEEQKALESKLSQMSDEQLDQVIQEGEVQDSAAIAGQAYQRLTIGKNSVKPSTALKTAYKVKATRISKIITTPSVINYSTIVAEQNKTIMKLNQTLINYTKTIALQNATIMRLNLSLMNYTMNNTNWTNSS